MKHRILHITGARPHFMKLAPVYHEALRNDALEQVIVHTGQHYDESLYIRFLREFDLPRPHYDLEVGSVAHSVQIGRVLIQLDAIFAETEPDIVFVYGDTNSTAAGAIAAAKSNIPVAHVEAGLREFDKRIPEEVNKLLVDAVTDLYFCSTRTAVENLAREGVADHVYQVGDVVVDLIHEAASRPHEAPSDHMLVTCHRAANTDDPARLGAIIEALVSLEAKIVFPVHPRTKNAIDQAGLGDLLNNANIQLIEPVGFWQMQDLIRSARMVLTDSGGVIREAYVHRRPCIILDDQTEWVESVNEGWAKIAGANGERIVQGITQMDGFDGPQSDFLGDGHAAERIINHTLEYLQQNHQR